MEDDNEGGEERFGRAGLTELERLADILSFEDHNSEVVAQYGKISAVDAADDCNTRSSALSLSRYKVSTGSRLAPVGARGSGRLP